MIHAPKLDRIDINILAELQRSGRITNADLADRVGLSPSPCLARTKRLEAAGYISGYSAIINLGKIGGSQIIFTSVTLGDHRRAAFMKFEQRIQNYDRKGVVYGKSVSVSVALGGSRIITKKKTT